MQETSSNFAVRTYHSESIDIIGLMDRSNQTGSSEKKIVRCRWGVLVSHSSLSGIGNPYASAFPRERVASYLTRFAAYMQSLDRHGSDPEGLFRGRQIDAN